MENYILRVKIPFTDTLCNFLAQFGENDNIQVQMIGGDQVLFKVMQSQLTVNAEYLVNSAPYVDVVEFLVGQLCLQDGGQLPIVVFVKENLPKYLFVYRGSCSLESDTTFETKFVQSKMKYIR